MSPLPVTWTEKGLDLGSSQHLVWASGQLLPCAALWASLELPTENQYAGEGTSSHSSNQISFSEQVAVAWAIWSTSLPGIQSPKAAHLVTLGSQSHPHYRKLLSSQNVLTFTGPDVCWCVWSASQIPNSSFKMLFVTMGLCQPRLLKGYAVGVGHTERSTLWGTMEL